jgi:CheY-like chemotaxis protein
VKQALQILVADDDATMRQSIKLLLEHDGHEVTPVDRSDAALARLAERRFDLVITDFLMPGLPGDELVAHIRKLIPAQPILMVTAFLSEYEKHGQACGGVDALLLKPFSRQQLQAAIEQALPHEELAQASDAPSLTTSSPLRNIIAPSKQELD